MVALHALAEVHDAMCYLLSRFFRRLLPWFVAEPSPDVRMEFDRTLFALVRICSRIM